MQDQSHHLQYIVIYILLKTEHCIFLYMLYYAEKKNIIAGYCDRRPLVALQVSFNHANVHLHLYCKYMCCENT